MRTSTPFCVLKRPFVVWSDDVDRDCLEFLGRIDVEFYDRAARDIVNNLRDENPHEIDEKSSQNQRGNNRHQDDVSSIVRLLWHHGIETLVMLIGAYIQAPAAVHAYFIKCRTEDTLEIAKSLLYGRRPEYNRTNDADFNLENLLRGLHLSAPWSDKEVTIKRFTQALYAMLASFTSEEHRLEYNSIKHGLRASHGQFAIMARVEKVPGVEAEPGAMQLVGGSREASSFGVAVPLPDASKELARVNFRIDRVTVAWSMDKVLYDLQILSILINNAVSALQISMNLAAERVKFVRPSNGEEWWIQYEEISCGSVQKLSLGIHLDTSTASLPNGRDVLASYTNKVST